MSLPLYKGGETNSRVRQASKRLMIAREQLRGKQLSIKRDVRSAYLGTLSAINRANALNQSVEAQKKALEAKREGFKSGLNTSLMVLDAERDFHFAERDYARARYDYILNLLKLEALSGRLDRSYVSSIKRYFK